MKHDSSLIPLRSISGIYIIRNLLNGKVYIGSSKEVGKRLSIHRSRLRGNYHPNVYLQRAWIKYGERAFVFELLEEINDNSSRISKETILIANFQACNPKKGYNFSSEARSCGMDSKVKAKISATKTGVPMKEETKIKLRMAKLGSRLSLETRQKISIKSKQRTGWKHSEQTKLLISQRRKGKPAWNKGVIGRTPPNISV